MAATTYNGLPIKYFIIDRLAAGFDRPTCASMFRTFFDVPTLSEAEIFKIVDNDPSIQEEIEARRQSFVADIERTNLVGILIRHINSLDGMAKDAVDTTEKIQILGTLQRFIESARPKQEKVDAPRQITVTNNYTQINSNFIVDLEKDGVLKIVDRAKFNRLYGLPAPEIDIASITTTSSSSEQPPHKKKELEMTHDDGPIESFA